MPKKLDYTETTIKLNHVRETMGCTEQFTKEEIIAALTAGGISNAVNKWFFFKRFFIKADKDGRNQKWRFPATPINIQGVTQACQQYANQWKGRYCVQQEQPSQFNQEEFEIIRIPKISGFRAKVSIEYIQL